MVSRSPVYDSVLTTVGAPSVSVPVLSKATTSTSGKASSVWISLIRIPFFAASPVPATSAVGVASPSAQGHAMTSTLTAAIRAYSRV